MIRPRSSKRCRWIKVIVALFIVVLGVFIWQQFQGTVPLRVSPETTLLTEPLASDGRSVDFRRFFEEHYPQGINTDENGFRSLLQLLFDETDNDEDSVVRLFRESYTALEKLNLPEKNKNIDLSSPEVQLTWQDLITFERYYREFTNNEWPEMDFTPRYNLNGGEYVYQILGFTNCRKNGKEINLSSLVPWDKINGLEDPHNPSQWESEILKNLESRLPEFDPIYKTFENAVKKKMFCIPVLPYEATCYKLNIKYCIFLFRVHAAVHLEQGNIDAAINDIASLERLGLLLLDNPGGSAQSLEKGEQIVRAAAQFGLAHNPNHRPTPQQWERFHQLRREIQPRYHIEETSQNELLRIIELIDHLKIRSVYGIDKNIVAKYILNETGPQLPVYQKRLPRICSPGDFLNFTTPKSWRVMTREKRSLLFARLMRSRIPSYTPCRLELYRQQRECMAHLQDILYAMQRYSVDHNGLLPPAFTVDKKGQPLHSWRVLLLPYLGQKELYQKIKLDEPWDRVHNRQFHLVDIPVYRCPCLEPEVDRTDWFMQSDIRVLSPGETSWSVIVDDNGIFDEHGKQTPFNKCEITRKIHYNQGGKGGIFPEIRATDTLVVERSVPVCWMNPA